MSLTTPLVNKAGLLALVQQFSGLGVFSVLWEEDQQPFVSPTDQAKMTLLVTHRETYGMEDHRSHYVPGAAWNENYGTWVTVSRRLKSFTVQFRAEAWGQSAEAVDVLETVTDALQAPWGTNALQALNYGVQRVGECNEVNYKADNRRVCTAICDVVFNVSTAVSVSQQGVGWIDSVAATALNGVAAANVRTFGPVLSAASGQAQAMGGAAVVIGPRSAGTLTP
jgi:hypothetical protein